MIPVKVGAPIILATLLSACAPSLGEAYERSFAAGRRAFSAGRFEEAAQEFETAAKNATRVKDRDEALFEVARMHEKRGAYTQARDAYERVTKTSPTGPRAARAAYDMALVEVDHGDAERGYALLFDATFKYPRHGSARRSLHRLIEHHETWVATKASFGGSMVREKPCVEVSSISSSIMKKRWRSIDLEKPRKLEICG